MRWDFVLDTTVLFWVSIQYCMRLLTLRDTPIHLTIAVILSPEIYLYDTWPQKPKSRYSDMLGVSPVTSCNGQPPLNPPACVDVFCMTCVVHRIPQSQRFPETLFLIIVWNHHLRTPLITPYSGFWFGLSVSVHLNDISFFRQHFINSVPGLFCPFNPLKVSSSGKSSSITKVLSACTVSAFLPIGYILANYVPLENTCAYQLTYNGFTRMSIVSVAHMYVSRFVLKTLSSLYRLDRRITAE